MIKMPERKQGGLLGSTLGKVGLGFATGGLAGAGLGFLGAKNPALGTMIEAGGAIGRKFGAPSAPPMPAQPSPWSLGANTDFSVPSFQMPAMGRRFGGGF
jgi:hypothetical protein